MITCTSTARRPSASSRTSSCHAPTRRRSPEQLHNLVARLVGTVPGIGELTVYDISLRIGSRFDLEPDRVYVHSGTRVGARALGFDGRRETIEIIELPEDLVHLRPRELEDLLCIYKDALAKAAAGRSAAF